MDSVGVPNFSAMNVPKPVTAPKVLSLSLSCQLVPDGLDLQFDWSS